MVILFNFDSLFIVYFRMERALYDALGASGISMIFFLLFNVGQMPVFITILILLLFKFEK